VGHRAEIKIWSEGEIGRINPNVYGHFIEHLGSCIYDGFWVGRDSKIPNKEGLRLAALEALKKIRAPLLRWPGGCFADDYHWMDGIGPAGKRPRRLNRIWGGIEDNSFGTHEFIRLCRSTGAEPYICLNVGSGSVDEAESWIEYCNEEGGTYYCDLRKKNGAAEPFDVIYWGIGNEPWGCGGVVRPETYADEYMKFTMRLRRLGSAKRGWKLIAAGHTADDWNLRFMERIGKLAGPEDMLSIHVYIGAGKAIDLTDAEYYNLVGGRVAEMEHYIRQAIQITGYFENNPDEIGIAMDEWGVWASDSKLEEGYYQQNTLRDALTAACCLHVFQKYPKKLVMANLAQAANVLMSLFLTKGEKFLLTPAYHVFDMMKPHQGQTALRTRIQSPCFETLAALPRKQKSEMPLLSVSASKSGNKRTMTLSVVNRHLQDDLKTRIRIDGADSIQGAKLSVLSSSDVRDVNTFEKPLVVKP